MNNNKNLQTAKDNINDEFYTYWEDVLAMLSNFKHIFKDKKILCPCDTKFSSFPNFFKWIMKMDVDYSSYPMIRFQELDFSKYDLVITNPPFSQAEEFVKQLEKAKVHYIIILPFIKLTTKYMRELVCDHKIHVINRIGKFFNADFEKKKVPAVWVTNIKEIKPQLKHNFKDFNEITDELHFSRDDKTNFRIYEKCEHIPKNYNGRMLVPVNFINKDTSDYWILDAYKPHVNGKGLFVKWLIQKKEYYY